MKSNVHGLLVDAAFPPLHLSQRGLGLSLVTYESRFLTVSIVYVVMVNEIRA